jgi:hypothetical protein
MPGNSFIDRQQPALIAGGSNVKPDSIQPGDSRQPVAFRSHHPDRLRLKLVLRKFGLYGISFYIRDQR